MADSYVYMRGPGGEPVKVRALVNPDGTLSLVNATPSVLVAGQSRTSITCTLANTDYPAGGAIPAGIQRAQIIAVTNQAVVGNEVTTATAGVRIEANKAYEFRVTPGDTIHVQSPNAGTVVVVNYLAN